MGVMGEAVQGALRQNRVFEQRDPFLHRPITGQNGRRAAVPLDDDLVDVAGLQRVQATQAEVINDQQIRGQEPPEGLLVGVICPRLPQFLQELIGSQEERVMAGPAGGVTEGGSQKSLADSHRPHEQHILVPIEEAEAQQIAHALAVEGDRRVPVEAFEGLFFGEARAL